MTKGEKRNQRRWCETMAELASMTLALKCEELKCKKFRWYENVKPETILR